MQNFLQKHEILNRQEILHFVAATIVAMLFFATLEFNPAHSSKGMMDWFFGADCWRVLENLKNSGVVSHERDNVHPFFSLFAVSVARAGSLFGQGVQEFYVYRIVFGTLGTLLFFALIYKESSPAQSFAALALLLSTMTLRVWSTLPETFLFGFFTLMLTLNLARLRVNVTYILLVSMAATVTNIVLGIAYALKQIKTKAEATTIAFTFLGIAVLLSVFQRAIYPTSDYFFHLTALHEEAKFVIKNTAGIPFRIFDFLVSGFAMPLPQNLAPPFMSADIWREYLLNGFLVRTESPLIYGSVVVIFALTTLAAIYVCSILGYAINKNRTDIQTMCFSFIVFELLLHMIYGDTPFLFSLHFTPIIIVFFAINCPERLRKVYPIGFLMLSVAIQYMNLSHFNTVFG